MRSVWQQLNDLARSHRSGEEGQGEQSYQEGVDTPTGERKGGWTEEWTEGWRDGWRERGRDGGRDGGRGGKEEAERQRKKKQTVRKTE